jgi:hypothetical protein
MVPPLDAALSPDTRYIDHYEKMGAGRARVAGRSCFCAARGTSPRLTAVWRPRPSPSTQVPGASVRTAGDEHGGAQLQRRTTLVHVAAECSL